MVNAGVTETDDAAGYSAVEAIYHAYLTGLILTLITKSGTKSAADVVFRTFRRQQLARFAPGLKKLGLDHGLEGYYREFDHDLAPEERLQFSPGEECPPFDPAGAPLLSEQNWPPARLAKVLRNYAMEYITSILPETIAALGPSEGLFLAGSAARLVGMHSFDAVAEALGGVGPGPRGFAEFLQRIARAQGDDAELVPDGEAWRVRQRGWRLMRERPDLSPAVFDAWNELWSGCALAHDRWLILDVIQRRDRGDPVWEWRVARRLPAKA